MFDRHTVCIYHRVSEETASYIADNITPAKSSLAVVTGHRKVTWNNILNGRMSVRTPDEDLLG
jgi:hypothetical protein